MTTNPLETDDLPEDPAELLPETSVLSLDEYLELLAAIGERTNFEIVYRLVYAGDTEAEQMARTLEMDTATAEDHLETLNETGLVQRRLGPDNDGGAREYYAATGLARAVLEDGALELILREREFEDAYSSDFARE